MQEKKIRIFALNPGSRYAGFAVFHGSELTDWGVKISHGRKHKTEWSARLKELIKEMTERDSLNCFAIKGLHPARRSKYLLNLTNELKTWAVKCGLIVCEYTIGEIEAPLLPPDRLNKRWLMDEVAARYAILYPEFETEKRNKNPYLVRMFEAVALGMKCLNDLEKSKGRKEITFDHENTKK